MSARAALLIKVAVVALAAVVAVMPLPATTVERYYATWFYPALQARLTSWSNQTGVALFDFVLAFLIAGGVGLLVQTVVRLVRDRSMAATLHRTLTLAVLVAIVYLWFAAVWGLNYARVPLDAAIGYDRGRINATAVRALAERAVHETNRGYAAAHAVGFPGPYEIPPPLVAAFHDVERRLGRSRATTPGRPKRTLLAWFFRASGTDGMHAPFLLETLLNPHLTPPERPAVLAHEWAHLAGYAPEDDASFVGLLAALRADQGARYSAWLTLTFEAANQLPRVERQRVLAALAAGPRQDQAAIRARQAARVETVQRVSWQAYDQYLKSQGVEEGLASYSRVVELFIGSGALDW